MAFKQLTTKVITRLVEALTPSFLGRHQDQLIAFGDELVDSGYNIMHDYVQPLYDFRATIISNAGATTVGTSDGSNVQAKLDGISTSLSGKEPTINPGTSLQYWRGDKTWQTLNTTVVPEGTNLYYTTARFNTDFAGRSTSNLSEGTNLYWTQARFDTAFSGKSTSNLTEGTNLYWTQARFDTALAGKSTSNLTEGTNLYFTNARAQAAITGGASTITTANLAASRALVSDGSGKVVTSATTATEIGTLSGVTSAIQTQLNGKANSATTLAGYGITDAVNNFGAQTIAGNKTFSARVFASGFTSNDASSELVSTGSGGDTAPLVFTSTAKTGSAVRDFKWFNVASPTYTPGLALYGYPASGGLTARWIVRDDGGFEFRNASGTLVGEMRQAGAFVWSTNDGTYSAAFNGRVEAYGATAGFNFADRATGPEWTWYATGNIARLNNGSDLFTVEPGYTTSNQALRAAGSQAALYSYDRTSGRTWAWYGTSDVFRLYNGSSDLFTFSPTGTLSAVAFQATSSIKAKDIEGPIPYGLEEIKKLNPVIGKYKKEMGAGDRRRLFLIAEEVNEVVPEVVDMEGAEFMGEKVPGLSKDDLVPLLIKGIQELEARVKELEDGRRVS